MTSKVENERIYPGIRSVLRSPWGAMPGAVSSVVGRLVPERWILELLALALGALLAGAAGLYGLAVMGARAPTSNQPSVRRAMSGDQEAMPGALDPCGDRWHCQETR